MVNAGWLGVQPLALNAIGLLTLSFIGRQLGSEAYGRFGQGLSAVMVVSPLTDLGLRSLAIRRLAQDSEGGRDYLNILISLRLLLALATCFAVYLAAPWLTDDSATMWVVRVAGLTLIPTTLMATLVDSLLAAERAKVVSFANMVGGLALAATSVSVVALGGREIALAVAYAAGPLVTAMILLRFARQTYGTLQFNWAPVEWKALVKAGFPFFRAGVLYTATQRIDTYIVGRVFGDAAAGGYFAATSLVDRLLIIPDSVSTAMLPTLSKLRKAGGAVGAQFADILLTLQLLTWPLALATIAAAPAILTLLLGPTFTGAWPILAVAIIALPVVAAGSLTSEALLAVRREREVTQIGMYCNAATLLAMYPFALVAGQVGTRLTKILSGIVSLLWQWRTLRIEFPTLLHDRRWPKFLMLVLATAAAQIPAFLLWPSIRATLGWATAVTIVAFAAMWRLRVIPQSTADIVLHLLTRLSGSVRRGRPSDPVAP